MRTFKTLHDIQREQQVIKQLFENVRKHLKDLQELIPYQIFYEHIKEHLEKNQKVCCKICGKTYEEIIKDAFEKKL